MITLWAELQILWSMYLHAAARFFWVFLVAVCIAAILTTYRLDRRFVPYFERTGLWGYVAAILLGVVSPF
jgi:uncharacterized membrane protein YraQ (UPF0718 family)